MTKTVDNKREQPRKQNRFDNPKIERPHRLAAGIPGVMTAMKFAIPENALLPLLTMNQPGGIDCPGCAWPEPPMGDRNIVEFCENGAKAVAEETTRRRVDPEFFERYSVTDLRQKTDYWLGRQGRITTPMMYDGTDDYYHPVSWDTAFNTIVDYLKTLDDPNKAIFYTSGRTANEPAYMFQLLARRFGTNNLPDCANMCHDSTGKALAPTVGLGKGSVTYADFKVTDMLISVGQNPGTNHPRMLTVLKEIKDNGGKIVTINPLNETYTNSFQEPQNPEHVLGGRTDISDRFLQIKSAGDHAFFLALNRELIRRDAIDHEFLDKFCVGADEAIANIMSLDDKDYLEATGLTMHDVQEVADMVEQAKSVIVSWTLGVTQHKNSIETIQEIANFLLLTGNIGKPGAGTAPLRGHSNVQGDRTVGIAEEMPESFYKALEKEFGFTCPCEPGWSTVDALRGMRDGKASFFWQLGGNFVRVTSDTNTCEHAMDSMDMTVSVSTKLNNTHAHPGKVSLILPTKARTDLDEQLTGRQVVTVEDSQGAVHASGGKSRHNEDLDLRSEVAIIGEIADRLFPEDTYWRPMIDDYSVIRNHIEATIPGFDNYNEGIKHPGGFLLPNGPRERNFTTPDGKAHLTVNKLELLDIPEGYFTLNTIRSHDQYNSTIYGLNDRYRGIKNGRRVVFVNPQDCYKQGLKGGDLVDIVSVAPDGERRAPNFRVVEYDTAMGCVAAYMPEANVLIPLDSFVEKSHTPISKSTLVRLEPLGVSAHDFDQDAD